MINIKEIKALKELDNIIDPSERTLHIARHLLYTLNPETILSEYKIIGEALIEKAETYKESQELINYFEENKKSNSNSDSSVPKEVLPLINRISDYVEESYELTKQAVKSYKNLKEIHSLLGQYIKEKGLIN